MKSFFIVLAMLWPTWLLAEDIKLANGQTVAATIKRTDPDGLVVETANGIEKLDFQTLSDEVQKKFGFDVEKAREYRAQQTAARQAMLEKQIAAVRARSAAVEEKQKDLQPSETNDRLTRIEGSAFVAGGTVVRGTRVGSIVSLGIQSGQAARHMLEKDTRTSISLGDGFVHGLEAADGESWQGKLFPAGYFRYTDSFGDEHTLRAYALTAADALARGGDARNMIPNAPIAPPTGLPGALRGGTMLDRR